MAALPHLLCSSRQYMFHYLFSLDDSVLNLILEQLFECWFTQNFRDSGMLTNHSFRSVHIIGGLAQMVERSLSMWKVRGSMPRSSNFLSDISAWLPTCSRSYCCCKREYSSFIKSKSLKRGERTSLELILKLLKNWGSLNLNLKQTLRIYLLIEHSTCC